VGANVPHPIAFSANIDFSSASLTAQFIQDNINRLISLKTSLQELVVGVGALKVNFHSQH